MEAVAAPRTPRRPSRRGLCVFGAKKGHRSEKPSVELGFPLRCTVGRNQTATVYPTSVLGRERSAATDCRFAR
ncbi:hypothetical protein MRX96_015967 [Rhipicephalus microplus]